MDNLLVFFFSAEVALLLFHSLYLTSFGSLSLHETCTPLPIRKAPQCRRFGEEAVRLGVFVIPNLSILGKKWNVYRYA
ncbi:hypothetical protein GGR52DRAFT_566081 [Hypoxylon sp. FL1284]|nr:hypothetical protein GGR52DRAFT_566081 [Hypoxylon sp. FL1284]